MFTSFSLEEAQSKSTFEKGPLQVYKRAYKKMVAIFFPEEIEILKEEDVSGKGMVLSEEIRKEILILHKLGLEDYEIRYLISLKKKREVGFKWEN